MLKINKIRLPGKKECDFAMIQYLSGAFLMLKWRRKYVKKIVRKRDHF